MINILLQYLTRRWRVEAKRRWPLSYNKYYGDGSQLSVSFLRYRYFFRLPVYTYSTFRMRCAHCHWRLCAIQLASITVLVQTLGKPHADFAATIQIHSRVLDSDISTVVDKPSNAVFANLPSGAYHVLVSGVEVSPTQLDITLSPGQSVELSLILDHLFLLILEPRHGVDPPAASVGELPVPDLDRERLDFRYWAENRQAQRCFQLTS